MVDVIDTKGCYPSESTMRSPSYNEKSGKLGVTSSVIRAL